jgi:hypothetical protein
MGEQLAIRTLSWKAWQMFVGALLLAIKIPSPFNEVSKGLLFLIAIHWLLGIGIQATLRCSQNELPIGHAKWKRRAYLTLLVTGIPLFVFMGWQQNHWPVEEPAWFRVVMAVVLLPATVAWFYMIGFALRALSILEDEREYGRSFWVNLLLLVYFPIGIWWLQPKLNRLVDPRTSRTPSSSSP